MRCPDCNKFVSYDEPECQADSVNVCDEVVTTSMVVNLNCAECGTNLKDAQIDAECTIVHECKPKTKRPKDWEPDPHYASGKQQFEIEDDGSPEGTSRIENINKKGKPIPMRYAKTFYGFTLESEIKCRKCGEIFSIELQGEEQASAFNENC